MLSLVYMREKQSCSNHAQHTRIASDINHPAGMLTKFDSLFAIISGTKLVSPKHYSSVFEHLVLASNENAMLTPKVVPEILVAKAINTQKLLKIEEIVW